MPLLPKAKIGGLKFTPKKQIPRLYVNVLEIKEKIINPVCEEDYKNYL